MEEKQTEHKRIREIKAVVCLALAVFLLLSLISYHPQDSSFTHFVAEGKTTHNFTGTAGSYSADSLIRLLGIGSFILPVIFLICSFQYFFRPEFTISKSKFFGFIFFTFSFAGLTAATIQTINVHSEALKAGGLIGATAVQLLLQYFNIAGTYILLSLILIVSLIFLIEFSLVTVAGKFSQGLRIFLLMIKNRLSALTSSAFHKIKIEKNAPLVMEEETTVLKKVKPKNKI